MRSMSASPFYYWGREATFEAELRRSDTAGDLILLVKGSERGRGGKRKPYQWFEQGPKTLLVVRKVFAHRQALLKLL